MTIQKRTLIELSDILAIEYGCPHCDSRYSVPIAKSDRRPDKCPNCHQPWLESQNANTQAKGTKVFSDDQLVSEFLNYLREVQGRTFGATLRLQVQSTVED